MTVILNRTTLFSIPEDQLELVTDLLEQHYWEDNGGETDGPAWLIETNEVPAELRLQLVLRAFVGTRLNRYDHDRHAEALNSLGVVWTGWQAEAYALIEASLAEVQRVLQEAADLYAREELAEEMQTIGVSAAVVIWPDERRAYVDGGTDADYRTIAAHFHVLDDDGEDRSKVNDALLGRYQAFLPVIEVV